MTPPAASAGFPGDPARAPDPLERAVHFFEHLSPADVARIGELYAPDASFTDPFNEVHDAAAIARIFAHMFEQVRDPRFVVRETVREGDSAFVVWDFLFEFRAPLPAGPRRVRGCSHLRFTADGRIGLHRDYWDAAGELYRQLPLLGPPMRWLRRRMSAPSPR